MKEITYGIGGYDPTKPNKNVVNISEYPDPPQTPLDPVGALATLLAVVGSITVEDAANVVGLTPADLVAEAQAWAAGSINNGDN
jgi:hypothetical protein